jgi:hypothetical protein
MASYLRNALAKQMSKYFENINPGERRVVQTTRQSLTRSRPLLPWSHTTVIPTRMATISLALEGRESHTVAVHMVMAFLELELKRLCVFVRMPTTALGLHAHTHTRTRTRTRTCTPHTHTHARARAHTHTHLALLTPSRSLASSVVVHRRTHTRTHTRTLAPFRSVYVVVFSGRS